MSWIESFLKIKIFHRLLIKKTLYPISIKLYFDRLVNLNENIPNKRIHTWHRKNNNKVTTTNRKSSNMNAAVYLIVIQNRQKQKQTIKLLNNKQPIENPN